MNKLYLGNGTYGQVKVKELNGVEYARKKLKTHEQYKTEVANHSSLPKHPHLVEFIQEDPKSQSYYMELCKSTSLLSLAEKPIPPNIVRAIIAQLIKAVQFLHDSGFVHRDIKLENILIGKDNNIKLCDFGTLCSINPPKQVERFQGTQEYMALELQLIKKPPYIMSDQLKEADIYSLGVVIFALQTRELMFTVNREGPGPLGPVQQQRYQDLTMGRWKDFWDKLKCPQPVSFKELIQNTLTRYPKTRWTLHQISQSEWLKNDLANKKEYNEFMDNVK